MTEQEAEYAYLVFIYGKIVDNILYALDTKKEEQIIRVPERYKEVTERVADYYNRYYRGKK